MRKIYKLSGLFFFLIISYFFLNSCNNSLFGIKGSGDIIKKEINLQAFTKIEQAIDADVVISKGDVQKIEIEGQENIIDNIITDVKSGEWIIDFDKKISTHKTLTVFITIPTFEKVILTGSGNIYSDDTFDINNLNLAISGSGDIDFFINSEDINISISGSGNIYLEGGTIDQNVSISGSGNYTAFNFFSKKSEIDISGSGNCEVYAQDDLFVTISGSGNVYYKGSPSINSMISGSGKIINSN